MRASSAPDRRPCPPPFSFPRALTRAAEQLATFPDGTDLAVHVVALPRRGNCPVRCRPSSLPAEEGVTMPLRLIGSASRGSSAGSSAQRAESERVSPGPTRPALRILYGGAAQPAREPSRAVTQEDRQQAAGPMRSHGEQERIKPAARPTLTVLAGGADTANTRTKGSPCPGARPALRVLPGAQRRRPPEPCSSRGSAS